MTRRNHYTRIEQMFRRENLRRPRLGQNYVDFMSRHFQDTTGDGAGQFAIFRANRDWRADRERFIRVDSRGSP